MILILKNVEASHFIGKHEIINSNVNRDFYKDVYTILRYFVPQVPITGKMLNGYPMFSVKNIVQNVKLIELWGKNLVPLHFVISKS